MKVVFFDLETMPDLPEAMKVFSSLSNYPGQSMKATINTVLCFGYKILGHKQAHVKSVWDYPKAWKKSVNADYELCKFAYEMLHDADAVITQNGKKFDWKFLQTRLMKHGLPTLPNHILHIDTKVVAKSNLFAFNNSLNILGETLLNEKKMKHSGWELWNDVYLKKPQAMKIMAAYCKQDVLLLEKLFNKLKPFIKNLPNKARNNDGCPKCGSKDVISRGIGINQKGEYRRLSCKSCASWFSGALQGKVLKP